MNNDADQLSTVKDTIVKGMEAVLSLGEEAGFIIEKDIQTLPELEEQMWEVVKRMLVDLISFYQSNGLGISLLSMSYGTWCAYAGIGAAYLWKEDPEQIREINIYEQVTGPCGIDAVDEYVLDMLGIQLQSDEMRELNDHLMNGYSAVSNIVMENTSGDQNLDMYTAGAVMYRYGVEIGLSRQDEEI
jgi:hypothetical protein